MRWIFAGFFLAFRLWAQSESASLAGTVADASGSPMPLVVISVKNEDTGLAVRTVTDEAGRYFVPGLRPATYTVTAERTGFKKFVNAGLTLQVNQRARLDIALAVGDVAEQITVSAEASILETETSGRGAVIDGRKIVELPLNGRDYNLLAQLSPGVLPATPRLQSIGFKGAFNVNGNRAFQNAFLLDGVDNTSYSSSFRGGNTQIVQPSIDALQEFKIQTNAYGAEFGRSAGAVVNAVIKSGTNALHGSAYEFHRNRSLDATNFFSNKTGSGDPFRLRNQFGGTLGGPIIKDKLFLFGDYEGLRDRTGTVRPTSVPQPIWTKGMFTVPIYNPFNPNDTGSDFQRTATADCNDGRGNCWIIPSSLIDPVGQKVLNVNPVPNTGSPGQVDINYVNVPVDRNRTDQFDIRVDENMADGFNLFGRYSFSDTNLFRPGPRPGLSEGSSNDTFGSALWRSQAVAAGATWTLSPKAVSESRFGWARGNYYQTPVNAGSGCPDQLIGIRGLPTDEAICGGLPVFDLPGGLGRRIGRTTSQPQFQTPRSYDFRESLAWIRSNHAMKFGAEILHVSTGIRDISALLGRFTFSGRFSGQTTGASAGYQGGVADLLMGLPTQYAQDSNTVFHQSQNMYFFFAQDDWKATRKLTVNYGVRYEFTTAPLERDNQSSNYDPVTRAFVAAKDGGLFERSLVHADYNNIGPRFGFAYTARPGTVLRGAYGVFYNHTNRMGREGLLGFNYPFVVARTQQISGSNILKASNAFLRLQEGIPAGFVDASKVDPSTVSRKAQDMNQRTPYTQQWNAGIQQELGKNMMFELAYVGNRGVKLPAFRNLNQLPAVFNAAGVPGAGPRPLAGFGLNADIQLLENLGVSNYHSLQARVEKRFSSGISGLLSYTWGKALTNAVDHLSTSGGGNGVDVGVFKEAQDGNDRRAEYGLAEFDVQHRLIGSAVWQLPFRRNRRLGILFGDWEFSPIVTVQSGLGLTIVQSNLLTLGGERQSRPNRIANGALPGSQRTVDRYFDINAFRVLQTNPAADGFVPFQAFGNSGVGVLRGPGLFNIDFNLSKNFALTEKHALQFRAEFFNALNRTNFGVPGVNISSGGFGQITQTSTEARIIQLALKYRF
jgi:outer membrane receptor protein involved in Fe transport